MSIFCETLLPNIRTRMITKRKETKNKHGVRMAGEVEVETMMRPGGKVNIHNRTRRDKVI